MTIILVRVYSAHRFEVCMYRLQLKISNCIFLSFSFSSQSIIFGFDYQSYISDFNIFLL